MKANSHRELLREFMLAGCGFDAASGGELGMLNQLGVLGKDIYFSSIAKNTKELALAREMSVRWISADSRLELEKIKEIYPEARILVRVSISEPSAGVPLSNRFGIHEDHLQELIRFGRQLNLRIKGLSIHVGSQCMKRSAWGQAVEKLRSFIDPDMSCVALGGGFPIGYSTFGPVPSLSECAGSLAKAAAPLLESGLEVLIEPGRVLAGPIGILVTSVLLVKPSEKGRKWLFLDAGAYNSLQIVCEGFDFHIQPLNESLPPEEYDICGPSCHSRDVFHQPVTISAQQPGDRLLILNAGAYTTPFVTPFCGNEQPAVEAFKS